MARGRKPQPAEVRQAKGNPGRRPIVTTPDAVPSLDLAPPKDLTAAAKAIWVKLTPALQQMKFLRATDFYAFKRYCMTMADWIAAAKKVKAHGAVYETDTRHGRMQRIHPWFIVMERLEKRLQDLEDRFGMNPRARQQMLQQMASAGSGLPFDPAKESTAGDQSNMDLTKPSPVGFLSPTKH